MFLMHDGATDRGDQRTPDRSTGEHSRTAGADTTAGRTGYAPSEHSAEVRTPREL